MDSTDDQVQRDERPWIERPALRFERMDDVQRDQDRREQLRAAELERMDDLYKRIEKGIDQGMVDLESGAKMLMNVSAARMALGGVGMYPGAF